MKRLILSMPKTRGFSSPSPKARGVPLGKIVEQARRAGSDLVTPETLQAYGLLKARERAKILDRDDVVDLPLTVRGIAVSRGARTKIEAAGGRVEEGPS
jgi:ribosomal protein L15